MVRNLGFNPARCFRSRAACFRLVLVSHRKGWGRDKPVTQVCMGVDAKACTTEFARALP